MKIESKWEITSARKAKLTKKMAETLAPLRAKAGISQDALAKLVGISRQTYSSIENGARELSWSVYLSLVMVFDSLYSTHKLLRASGAYPEQILFDLNGGYEIAAGSTILDNVPKQIIDVLDDAAYQALRTVIMLEYARITGLPGDAVVKSFEGVTLSDHTKNPKATAALKAIRKSRGNA